MSSELKATPGPWMVHASNRVVVRADGAFNEITVKDGKVEGDELPYSICLLRDPDEDFSEDETLANGFLIAAAPALYEALRVARNQVVAFGLGPAISPAAAEYAVEHIDAALSLARGERP